MQIINHKNAALTVCQRFFIEKSLELLYLGSIDSYRVRLHNPKTVLEEIKYCLEEFQQGRIKHFHTIKAKDKEKKALIDETITLLNYDPNYLEFNSITQKYLKQLLNNATENNFKKIISGIGILLAENDTYLTKVIDGLSGLIAANSATLADLEKIDTSLNILFSELISKGYSKGFLYKLVYGIFVNTLNVGASFNDHFTNFRTRLLMPPSEYEIIFRIDTTQKVYDSISAIQIPGLILANNIDDVILNGRQATELAHFNVASATRKFIRCKLNATDYLAALKKARSVLSEYLDVINLGLSDEFLQIHSRALVIDSLSPEKGDFQNNVNILDGKYRVEKDHYQEFTRKLPSILNSPDVQHETKEKIKSAIRYLRLGNQSTEVEHKFINYWIGLEYIFSNYESQNTINRIKEHFINAHALAYTKRNTYSFKKDFAQIPGSQQALVPAYTAADESCLSIEMFYTETGAQLLNYNPLLAYRALKFHKWFFPPGGPANATDYLRKHSIKVI